MGDGLLVLRTLTHLQKYKQFGDSVSVAFSGGMDSLVTLDLCRRLFPNTCAYHMYLVPGLDFIERPIERYCTSIGVPLVMVPHWNLSQLFRAGVYMPGSHPNFRHVKQKHIERHIRFRQGTQWIAYGHKQTDSISRRYYLNTRGMGDLKDFRLAPIWNWTPKQVSLYVKLYGLEQYVVSLRFGQEKMGGLKLNKRCLCMIKEKHPDDFRRILDVFPVAETLTLEESKLDLVPEMGDIVEYGEA